MGLESGRIRNVAVGLVARDGYVLVERYPGDAAKAPFYRAIGGGIEFGERAADAVVREFREELDADVTVTGLLAVCENFFTWQGEPGHEVVHVFEVASPVLAALPLDAVVDVRDEVSSVVWARLADLARGEPPFYPDGVFELARGLASAGRPRVTVRPYASSDAAATAEVFFRAVRETAIADYSAAQVAAWAPHPPELSRWDANRLEVDTFVAEGDGRVLGFADLCDDGLVDMLFVHPDAGRRGVARALLDQVVVRARELGVTRLYTFASRTARPVFEHLGWIADTENTENWIRGENLPNVAMHRDLD